MSGRPKTHPDTSPKFPNRLSPKALDLLRRAAAAQKPGIFADNEPEPIVDALLARQLIYIFDYSLFATDAGRALIEKIDGKAK